VLGANAINEHNVIFDPDGLRVGFARSLCTYDKVHSSHDFATSTNDVPKTPVKTPAKNSADSSAAQKSLPVANSKEDPVVPPAPKTGGNGAMSASALKKMKAKEIETAASLLGALPLQPSEPKPTPPTQHLKGSATAKPVKGSAAAATAKSSQLNSLFPVPLTPVHKENLASLVAIAADSLLSERNINMPCRRVLTMPCNARCDRPPSPEVQALDFGK